MQSKTETKFAGCGVPVDEVSSQSAGGGMGGSNVAWDHTPVTWKLLNSPRDVSLSDCKRIMQRAFDVWMQNSSLDAREVGQGQAADIEISFKSPDQIPQLGSNFAIAFYPDAPNKKGDVVFNLLVTWDLSQVNDHNTESILFCYAVHEIGHAIGIKQHGNPTFDVMQADPANWSGRLSDIDINFVQSIYANQGALNA